MDYSQYEPPIIWDKDSSEGFIEYSEVHAKRQSDAEVAYMTRRDQGRKRMVEVRCPGKKSHCLAWVELTPDPVIVYWVKSGSVGADLKRVRAETGIQEIGYVQRQYFDFLNAGDDLDLEAKCDCGGVRTLDRAEIQDALSKGKKTVIARQ